MITINVTKINEVYLHVYCDDMGVEAELSDFFTFMVPGAQFMPKFKAKLWDGKIRLYDPIRKTLYVGLLPYLIEYAKKRDFIINKINMLEDQNVDLLHKIEEYVSTIDIRKKNNKINPHDYQIDAINQALTSKRCILVSPTGSGKSLIIYIICRMMLEMNHKCLVIVPSTSLVEQMYSDFEDYSSHDSWDPKSNCQKLYSGFTKEIKSNILFSTWQSIYKLPSKWFEQFGCIIGDEAHTFKAQSLVSILEKLTRVEYRIGTTGTLQDSKIHKLVLEGLFGPVYNVTSTKKLQDDGKLAPLKITSLVLTYPDDERKLMLKKSYQDEIEYIVTHPRRNKFIKNLTLRCNGNTLVLFQFVKKQGKPLYEMIKDSAGDRKVFIVHGEIDTEDREQVRMLLEKEKDAIIIASYGVYQQGINIPSIENIIFASPALSKIRNLQSIGRGLRLNDGKTHCNLYDLTDNFKWKSHINVTFKHGSERYKLYISEGFEVKLIEVKL